MSPKSMDEERTKYYRLHQLAKDQIVALEANDLPEFDRIMTLKDAVIKSFGDPSGLLEADPSLAEIAADIQASDGTALRLLYEKLSRVKRQMTELNQFKTASAAYAGNARPKSELEAIFAGNKPRFIDRNS